MTPSQKHKTPREHAGPGEDPLDEVYRRIVRAHASLAESVGGDRERIGWVLHELMDTLRYIDSVSAPPLPTRGGRAAMGRPEEGSHGRPSEGGASATIS